MTRKHLIAPILLVIAMLACNAPTGQTVVEPTAAPESEPTIDDQTVTEAQSEPTAAPPDPTAAPPDPTDAPAEGAPGPAACPTATEGTQLVSNEAAGYCFLAPAEFETRTDNATASMYDVWLSGEALQPGQIETPSYYLSMNIIGAPGTAANVTVDQWLSDYTPQLPPDAQGEPVTITWGAEGNEAPVTIIPGMFSSQAVYIKMNDTLYVLETIATEGTVMSEEQVATVDAYWQTALDSLAFFAPQADTSTITRYEDVCPEAGPDTQVDIDLQQGFCYLLPADWQPDPDFPGRFFGGPEIDEYAGGFPPYATVVVSSGLRAGYTSGIVPLDEYAEDARNNASNPALVSYEIVTIGAREWAIILNERQPVPQRTGITYDGDYLYAVVTGPYDPDAYSDEYNAAYTEMFTTLTESLATFDPWR